MGSSHLSSILEREKENYKKEVIDEFIEKGIKIGFDIGYERKGISIARKMLERDMSIEDISEATGLSVEKINSLK